jgi:hypothetical protein
MNANTNVGNTLGYYNSVNSQKETAPEYKCGTDFRIILIPTRTCTR